MEVSKTLQENITRVQNQLKLAIQNHQVILLKHQSNLSSGNLKVQLWEVQKHIISLGEAQKRLVQQLRKELEANSTNCTLSRDPVHPLKEPSPLPSQEPPATDCRHPAPDRVLSPSDCHVESPREQKCVVQKDVLATRPSSKEVEPRAPASSPKHKSTSSLDADTSTTKLDFMSSLGLVTQECLAELRNRRVERKRRSTANHVHFVYGNSWDMCKRKKGNYLSTSTGTKLPAVPKCRTSSPEEKVFHFAPALRILGVPESLTIKRITSSEPMCVVCRKTDNVQVCTKCSSSYHNICISDGNCPRCYKPDSSPPNGTSTPTISEKMKQKLEMLMKSNALCVEKSTLEQRKAQLISAIQEQDAVRSEMLKQQEETTVSIQRVHSFVQSFQRTPC